jgi:hypothetical protein
VNENNEESSMVDPKIVESIVAFLIATPRVLFSLIASFFSGHLWMFIVLTYAKRSRRGNTRIDNPYGRIAIGVGWFVLVMLVVYWVRYGCLDLQDERIMEVLIPTLAFGISLEMVAFVLVTSLAKER